MSSPLLSLAILRVNQNEYGNDYLDSLLPMIARILPNEDNKPIDVDETVN